MSQRHIESEGDLKSLSDPGHYNTTETKPRQEDNLLDTWQGLVRGSHKLFRTAFSTPVIRRGLLFGTTVAVASLSLASFDSPERALAVEPSRTPLVEVPVGDFGIISGVTTDGKILEATQILKGRNSDKITAVIYPDNYANYQEAIVGAKKFATYQFQAYPFSKYVQDYDFYVVNPDNIERQECKQNGDCPQEPFVRNIDRFMQATGKTPHENYQLVKSDTHLAGGQGVVALRGIPPTIYNQISVVLPLELIADTQMMNGPHETGAKYGYGDSNDQTSVMGNYGVRTFNSIESAFIERILSNPATRARRYYLSPDNEMIVNGISTNLNPNGTLREIPALIKAANMDVKLDLRKPVGTTQHYIKMTQPDGPGVNLILSPQASFELKAPQLGKGPYVSLPGQTQTWTFCSSSAEVSLAEGDTRWQETIEAWPDKFFTNKCRIIQIRMPDADPSLITTFDPQPEAIVATTSPLLRWINADPSIFYNQVQLSKDSTFNTDPQTAVAAVYDVSIHGAETTPLNSWQAPNLEPGSTYFWRVTPVSQGDAKKWGWSQTWSFTTPVSVLKGVYGWEPDADYGNQSYLPSAADMERWGRANQTAE